VAVDLAPGLALARFVLERKLGRGAAGVVYLAIDTLLNEPVALKVLHAHLVESYEVRERFKREIVLTRRVTHPGVCRLHDLHVDQGITFVTMEYVEGQTLAELVHVERRLSPERTLEILRSLAPPLEAAHAAGIVHRDLKPGNIMVRPDGTVSVLDFGMATADDVSRITHAGRTVGSLRFIAPEVWEGAPATPTSDIYAVGVILYACLAGQLPYEATTPAEAFQAQRRPPPPLGDHNPAVTPAIDAVVRRAMARRPDERFHSAAAVLHAYEAAISGIALDLDSGSFDGRETAVIQRTPSEEAAFEPGATLVNPAPLFSSDTNVLIPAGLRAIPRPAIYAAVALVAIVVIAVIAALASDAPARPKRGDEGPPRAHLVERAGDGDDDGLATTGGDEAPREDVDGAADPSSPSESFSSPAAARAAVGAVMKKRGFLPGDVPAVDGLLARARTLENKGRTADALAALSRARTLAARESIDRGFITAKHKRLRLAAERAGPRAQEKVAPIEREVEKLAAARDYVGAHERLNRGFSLLR
jgi:eukaryotic-like serine/threonine-protein kinase